MRATTKFIATLALAAPLLCMGQASAATYKLPITGGDVILKIFVDNGVARRVGATSQSVTYEVEMNGSECLTFLRIAFANYASPLRVRYDVCSEKGFALKTTRYRF